MSNFDATALDALVQSNTLTTEGRDWLIQTLDPFHDTSRTKAGYPDITNGNSFIQQVTLTKSFPVLEATDFHIFSMPHATVRQYEQYPMDRPTRLGAPPYAGYGPLGPLNVVQAAPDRPTMPYFDEASKLWKEADIRTVTPFNLEPYLIGECRLVSMGFEVINTGPELLKSGALVTYRSPQACKPSFLDTGSGATAPFAPIVRSSLPPAFAEDALNIFGSQQWEAYDGAYLINTMFDVNNPATVGDYLDQWYMPGNYQLDSVGVEGISLGVRSNEWFPIASVSSRPVPFNTAGAYLTGAALGTTLTVVLKAYIECFPTPDLKSYVTLTNPSAPYDPEALEYYSRVAFHMKPAVKQSMNPGGEYWKLIKGVINTVVPRISPAIKETKQIAKEVKQLTKGMKAAITQPKTFGIDQTSKVGMISRGKARKNR